jgi:type II secretory pathway component PulF
MRTLIKNKKGNLDTLYPAIMTFVIVGILLGVGLIVLDKFMLNIGTSSAANTSVNNTIKAIGDFSGWFGIIVVVLAAAIILAIVIGSFARRQA